MTAFRSHAERSEIEARVVERARRGDDRAFALIVRHYDPGLRALAFRLLGDPMRMDDALQETYVSAFRALPRFRATATLSTWLYRIAYNACLDELKRPGRAVPLEHVPERPDPKSSLADRFELRHELAQALADLAPADRAAVILVDAQGFDYRAASDILGVPEGTVASRLNRARASLRRTLATSIEGAVRR